MPCRGCAPAGFTSARSLSDEIDYPMKLGYARIAASEQDLDLQILALQEAGAEMIFTDYGISGAARAKPALDECLKAARIGDEIIVFRLDRLAGSLHDLVYMIESFSKRGFAFRSIQDRIETGAPTSRFAYDIFGTLAAFERDMTHRRSLDGITATGQG